MNADKASSPLPRVLRDRVCFQMPALLGLRAGARATPVEGPAPGLSSIGDCAVALHPKAFSCDEGTATVLCGTLAERGT